MTTVVPEDTNAILVILDLHRYRFDSEGLTAWLCKTLRTLHMASRKPILVSLAEEDGDLVNIQELRATSLQDQGVHVAEIDLTSPYSDSTAQELGTPYYGSRALEMARQLGLVELPNVLHIGARMIVVDLDNTLYSGVLAEDGVDGLLVTDGHCELLTKLKDLSKDGVPLAVCSKNDPDDVTALLKSGLLSPLEGSDFAIVTAGWNSKSEQLGGILALSRLVPPQVVFLDDNAGELASLLGAYPSLRVLPAASPSSVARALEVFPGLSRRSETLAGTLRSQDIRANQYRDAMQGLKPEELLRELEVVLTLSWADDVILPRLLELSRKTNQFNTNLSRLTSDQLQERVHASPPLAVAVGLSDRFSDSGIVGLVTARKEGDELLVDEVAVSCRALGRGVEDPLLEIVLAALQRTHKAAVVKIASRIGPRNAPAIEWLSRAGYARGSGRVTWVPRPEVMSVAALIRIEGDLVAAAPPAPTSSMDAGADR